MIHTKKQTVQVETGFTCDRCGKQVDVEELTHQEALHINTTGGYLSVFGDGVKVECDLCQDCVKDLLGQFCRVTPAQ